MALKEELNQLADNTIKDMRQLFGKIKKYPLISFLFIIVVLLLIAVPYMQVSLSGITNLTERATQENQYRATLAQILGGVAIGIGLYYTWRRIGIAENNLKVSQDGQITERFTRAIDQLGNEKIEIRLGGIYALERIADESEKDYWPIMEILTAYIRNNSPAELIEIEIDYDLMVCKNYEIKKEKSEIYKLPLDIQAILTVIGRRKYSPYSGETEYLDLSKTDLSRSNLISAHLEEADLQETNLKDAKLQYTNLQGAFLRNANLQGASLNEINLHKAILKRAQFQYATLTNVVLTNANLQGANLKKAFLIWDNFECADFGADEDFYPSFLGLDLPRGANLEQTHFSNSNLKNANLKHTNLKGAVFDDANFEGAYLEGANLRETDLREAKNLTVDQLSKVKTLYKAVLDEGLEADLRAKGFGKLIDDP